MAVSTRTRFAAGAASVTLNGLVLLAAAGLGARGPDRVWVEDAVMNVSLVAVRGGETPAPAPSAQAPSTLEAPAPAPPPPTELPVRPTPAPMVAAPVRYVAEAAPSPPSAPSAPASQTPQAPAPASAPPQRQGTRDGLDIDAPNGTSTDYASRLRAWLEAHKTYPRRSRMRREEGVVHLHFAVDRRGRLLAGDVVRSSGFEALDAEALAMLGRADPFPSAPKTVRGERIEISTPVQFELPR